MDGEMFRRRQNTMVDSISPLLTSMRVFGLYFVRPDNTNEHKNWKCSMAWMFNAVFVVALLWLNAVRLLSVFHTDDTFDWLLLNKIIVVLWSFQCAVSQTAFFATCYLGTLQKVFAKMKLSDGCAQYLRRMVTVYTIVTWSVIAIGSAFWMYAIFFTDGSMDIILTPFVIHVPISNVIVAQIVMYLLSFYLLAAHSFPQAMAFLLAMLFGFQFKLVGDDLDRRLEDSEDGHISDADIEEIRQKHQEIAMSVSNVDDCLMFHNASAFCCQLCCFIIFLYMIIFYNNIMDNPVIITANIWWIVLMTAGLVFTSAGGIKINHYVSRPALTRLTLVQLWLGYFGLRRYTLPSQSLGFPFYHFSQLLLLMCCQLEGSHVYRHYIEC